MKRTSLTFSPDTLQHLGLLIAFVLLVTASGFAATRPVVASIVVFAFSLPYLIVCVVTRRARLLYPALLLGTVSYFWACHALGAPGTSFPILSVPLVFGLLIVGHRLRKKLSGETALYPIVLFRAMNITIGAFSVWALW